MNTEIPENFRRQYRGIQIVHNDGVLTFEPVDCTYWKEHKEHIPFYTLDLLNYRAPTTSNVKGVEGKWTKETALMQAKHYIDTYLLGSAKLVHRGLYW